VVTKAGWTVDVNPVTIW